MKKMLVLMLVVLGMTSLASATVDIYITDAQGQSEIWLAPSDTVELSIWYAGDDIISFDLEAEATGPGTILSGAVTATGRNPDYDGVAMPGMVYGYDIELTGSSDADPLGSGLAQPLATIQFHCDDEGDVDISMFDVSTFDLNWTQVYPVMHGITIHQVPEPATMSLLCLGGLILKRRK